MFGSIECLDIAGTLSPVQNVTDGHTGFNKGIQGHHNSCYMDATLFSMFAFTMVFDAILYRRRRTSDIERYEDVQSALRDGIVNPLRK